MRVAGVRSGTFGLLVRARWWPFAVLLVAAAVLVVAHTSSYRRLGPLDELQHVDYLDKVGHFQLPRFAEPVGQRAMTAMACRHFDANFRIPYCNQGPFRPQDFPEGGQSYELLQPPLYYTAVGVPSRLLAALPGGNEVGWARLLGAVWLGGALCLMLSAATRLGAATWPAVAVLVAMASTEQVLYLHSTVNNDATALLSGALCLWAVVHDRGDVRWSAVLVGAGVLAGATKLTNGFGVGVACVFALGLPWVLGAVPDSWRDRLRPAALLAGGYLVATVVWQGVFVLTRMQNPSNMALFQRYRPAHLTLQSVLSQIPVYADPFRSIGPPHAPLSGPVYIPHLYQGPVPSTVTLLVSLVLVTATFGSWTLLAPERRGPAVVLGATASGFLLLGAPLQYYAVYFATGAAETQSRYVYSVLPAMAMTTAILIRRPSARIIVVALAALGVLSIVIVSLWSQLA